MKAVVLVNQEDLRVMDVPFPRLTEEDHILIAVKACGVCGSDIRYYYGENPWALHTLGYHIPNPRNIILGHEYSGIVTEVNSPRYAHLIGKHVGIQPWKGCGVCEFCRSGRENLCEKTIHTGHGQGWGIMDFYPGAMAEYCIAWGDYVTEIPDETSFEAAAMADILGVAIHAAGRAPIRSGSDILCIGGGPAGVYTALMALRKGAKKAFILEKSAIAREIIRKFNSCESFDPGEKAWQDLMRTKRNGFSAIYDSVGASELFEALLPLLEPSGTYINMAVHNLPVSISPSLFGCERIITSASNALYNENKEAVSMIVRKEIEAGKIITHYATFDTFMDNFELLLKDPKEAFKVVLRLS